MLDQLEIAATNQEELFYVLDSDMSGELDVREMITGLMTLRGQADKSDSVAALLGVRYCTGAIEGLHRNLIDVASCVHAIHDLVQTQSNGCLRSSLPVKGSRS